MVTGGGGEGRGSGTAPSRRTGISGPRRSGRGHLAARGPRVVPSEPFGVGGVEHREAHGRAEPPLGVEGEGRIEGEPGGQGEPGRLGGPAEDAQLRPGPLGVHVVGGDRRDPAPVVDPRRHQRGQVVGEVRGGLQVDLGGQDQPGDGDGPQELVGRAGRPLVHGGARLGQEVLDDDLLHVAVAPVAGGDGLERGHPVLPGLTDAHQEPGGEGDAGPTRRLQGGQPPGRGLVGGRAVGVQVRVDRLDHHALAGGDLPEAEEVGEVEGPGVGVREQSGLLDDGPAGGHQVVDGGAVAVGVQPLPGGRVPVLGALTQGEQGLVAAGGPAGPGDGRGPGRARGRATRPGPGPWRRCSSRTGRGTAWSGG